MLGRVGLRWRSSNQPQLAFRGMFDKATAKFKKHVSWQKPKGDAGLIIRITRPKIGAGPNKHIGLCCDNPRPLMVKSQTAFGRQRNLQGIVCWNRRRMGYSQHDDLQNIPLGQNKNNRAGAVFGAFEQAAIMLATPQVAVVDDKADSRRR